MTRTRAVAGCRLTVVSVLLAVGGDGRAGTDEPAVTTQSAWTVDAVVGQERTTSWTLSRDGRRALWVRWRADGEADRSVPCLMLLDVETGKSRELTVGRDGVSSPSFSHDGNRALFVTSRKAPAGVKGPPPDRSGPQIWQLDLRGGDARPITSVPHGVSSFHVVDSGDLFLLSRERLTRRERARKKQKDDTIVVEDPVAHEQGGRSLFRRGGDGSLKRIVTAEGPVEGFAVSPDGRFAVTWHASDPSFEAEGKNPPRWFLRDLLSNVSSELFARRRSKPYSALWRDDSKGCYLVYPHATVDGEDSAATVLVKHLDARTGTLTEVPLDWERGIRGGDFAITPDGFIANLCNGVRSRPTRFIRTAGGTHRREPISGEISPRLLSLSTARDSSRVLCITGGASDPDHVLVATLDGSALRDAREIYRPNSGFKDRPIARTEVVRWRGSLDEEIEGVVYYPNDYRPGRRHPLVVITHGGPHAADRDRFSERWANSPNLYTQRGAFVLKTNYHGSSDYGLAFGESIKGRYLELEVKDIFAGVQKLIDEGKVDRSRMGLVGWSNGAILSIACLTLAHLYAPEYDFTFKACAPGAGDVNWTSDYGNCAFGGVFDDFYLGGPPWKRTADYVKKSALFHVERVTTPTIIFFGTEDRAVPTSQGWEWYRALHSVGKAPVRFLLFPGAPHGLRKLSHQRRKLEEELKWLDRYLFESAKPDVVVPDGSLLDIAKKRRDFARVGGRLGVRRGAHLVPETVPFGGVEIGRFEVTVAQWRAFDPAFLRAVPPQLRALPDHPATGLTADDARAYVDWLRRETKEPWRLMAETELAGLAASKGSAENTLDLWAGYAPPPAEAAALSKELGKLGLAEVLMPVGSRPPGRVHGPDAKPRLVFDVGGNAAELVVDASGELVPRGGVAIHSPDERAAAHTVPADYVGLRVVKGPAASGSSRRRL